MSFRVRSTVCAIFLLANGFCQLPGLCAQTNPTQSTNARSVVIGGNLSDHELLRLSVSTGDSVLLLDRPYLAEANLRFLQSFAPEMVTSAGVLEPRIQEIVQKSGIEAQLATQKEPPLF